MPHSKSAQASWRKSSHSGTNANCIEVAPIAAPPARDYLRPGKQIRPLIAVRDSKYPDGATLYFSNDEWCRFINFLRG